MLYYTVRCDIAPGKEEELDRFTEKAKAFRESPPESRVSTFMGTRW